MKIQDLFDKNQKYQLDLLTNLIKSKQPIKKDVCLKRLNVSAFLLDRALEDLQDTLIELNLTMSLDFHSASDSIALSNYTMKEFNSIYYHFSQTSINHSIIRYLYLNRNFNMYELSTHLSISISTLYRYIAYLNEQLEEFQLTIRNGSIQGDNLQLCYFFYQFFWHSAPTKLITQTITDYDLNQFINLLEKKLNVVFTQNSKIRILLWCKILKRSNSRKSNVSQVILKLIDEIQEDSAYKIIRECYFLSQSYSAFLGSDYNAAYIYIFLLSAFPSHSSILEELCESSWPTKVHAIIDLNESILEKVCHYFKLDKKHVYDSLSFNHKHLLSSIHSGILFFKGKIEKNEVDCLFLDIPKDFVYKDVTAKLIDWLGRKNLWNFNGINEVYLTWVYHDIISAILNSNLSTITIGINLNKSPLIESLYTNSIKKIYITESYVHVEPATPNKKYDIIISDDETAKWEYNFRFFYLMEEIQTDYGKPIREVLKNIE